MPGLIRSSRGLLRFGKDREGLKLARRRIAQHQRPADLRVVAVDLRRQFGGDGIAFLQFAIGGWLHADDFGPAGRDQHEIVLGAVGFEKRLDFGDQFEFAHAGFDHFGEVLVAAIRQIAGLLDVPDLFGRLDAAQLFDVGGRGNRQRPAGRDEALFHELEAGDRGSAARECARELGLEFAGGDLGIPGIAESDSDIAGSRQTRERVVAREVEIHQAAEWVLAPRVSVEQDRIPAALGHQIEQLGATMFVDHRQGDTLSRNHSVGSSRPKPIARARFTTAAPTAANCVPAPVLLLNSVI